MPKVKKVHCYLIENLEKANFQTISKLFNDSMSKVLHNKVLIYITDTAPYMIKSGKALKVFLSRWLKMLKLG